MKRTSKLRSALGTLGLGAAAAFGTAAAPDSAEATPVTWEADLLVGTSSMPGVNPGDSLTATFSFDTTSPDLMPSDPNRGQYAANIILHGLPGGDQTFSSEWIIFINDLIGTGGFPLDGIGMVANGGPSLVINMSSSDTNLLSSISPVGVPPTVSSFDLQSDFIVLGSTSFEGTVTALRAIPEPGTGILLGLGLGATAAMRRNRKSGHEIS